MVAQGPLKLKVGGSYPPSSTNNLRGPDGTAGVLHTSIDSVRFRGEGPDNTRPSGRREWGYSSTGRATALQAEDRGSSPRFSTNLGRVMKNEKYSKEILTEAVCKSISVMDVLRNLGLKCTGGNHSHIKKRILTHCIDTSHFTGSRHNKGKKNPNRKKSSDILVVLDGDNRPKSYQLTRALLESNVNYTCVECGCDGTYNGKPITLHVDHIDGNWRDSRITNLRFLCPNCHSQTDTFGNKNARMAER